MLSSVAVTRSLGTHRSLSPSPHSSHPPHFPSPPPCYPTTAPCPPARQDARGAHLLGVREVIERLKRNFAALIARKLRELDESSNVEIEQWRAGMHRALTDKTHIDFAHSVPAGAVDANVYKLVHTPEHNAQLSMVLKQRFDAASLYHDQVVTLLLKWGACAPKQPEKADSVQSVRASLILRA